MLHAGEHDVSNSNEFGVLAPASTEFGKVRDFLKRVRCAVGNQGLVSLAWNGETLTMQLARAETGKKMFIATFDGEDDFTMPAEDIIRQFAALAEAHFA